MIAESEAGVGNVEIREARGWLLRLVDLWVPERLLEGPEEPLRMARNCSVFLMLFLFLPVVYAYVNYKNGIMILAVVDAIGGLLILPLYPALKYTGRYVLLGNIAMSVGMVVVANGCVFAGGVGAPAALIFPLAPMAAFLGFGRRSGVGWTITTTVVILTLYTAQRLGMLPEPSATPVQMANKHMAIGCGTVLLSYLFGSMFHNIAGHAMAIVKRRGDEIAGINGHLHQLFDGMRQGVLAFGPEGTAQGEVSAQAHHIFARKQLAGVPVFDLLFAAHPELQIEAELFQTWQRAVFEAGLDAWDELATMAPTERVATQGGQLTQYLRLEFRPISEEGKLVRVMMLVTDETEHRLMAREAEEREEVHRRQMAGLRRLATSGAHLFIDFLRGSELRLANVRDALDSGPAGILLRDVEYAFRQVHTIKGDARSFDLEALADIAAAMEVQLAKLREDARGDYEEQIPSADVAQLLALAAEAAAELSAARQRLVEVSPVGDAILDQITVRRSDVERLRRELGRHEGEIERGAGALFVAAERLAARPFGECTANLIDSCERWAAEVSKLVTIEVQGREEAVSSTLAFALTAALPHLVRNAIAHGIELPGERAAQGKQPAGRIVVRCSHEPTGAVVMVEDDGAGIDTARLAERARSLSLEVVEGQEQDLIFADGLSTSGEDEVLSGRGVGLPAVRQELAAANYAIRMESTRGRGTRFVISSFDAAA